MDAWPADKCAEKWKIFVGPGKRREFVLSGTGILPVSNFWNVKARPAGSLSHVGVNSVVIYPCSSAYSGVAATRLYAVSICG
jgi:hypothetical protein